MIPNNLELCEENKIFQQKNREIWQVFLVLHNASVFEVFLSA